MVAGIPNKKEDVWKKINILSNEECWEWRGSSTSDGYGRMDYHGKKFLTHRLVYELTYGSIPDNLCVLHHCDNPKCCNPTHLFSGTVDDNIRDKIQKKRQSGAIGNKNSHCKINDLDVIQIKLLYASGKYYQRELAIQFGITQSTISAIIRGDLWKHLK